MTDTTEQALVGVAWPYWECEGEIAKRFFENATDDDHVFYLRAQLWKELHPVDGFFNGLHRELKDLVDRYGDVDRDGEGGIDRHDYHFLLVQLAEEFNHYVMLADIFEHLVGRKITEADTVQLAEEKKLGDVRRAYVDGGDELTKAAVGFTEGGGARLFREGAKLSGSTVNDMTAAAMCDIYDDEKDHYAVQAKICVDLIRSDDDLARMKDAIRAISDQRVRMRAEMFPGAMTEAEIAAFIDANARA